MDIYKAFNEHINLLKYEIYVKLNQANESDSVIDKKLLVKLMEYEEAEEQRAYMTLFDLAFISTSNLEYKDYIENAKTFVTPLISVTKRKLYIYSVLNSSNVTDPYEKLYYLKSLDENIFSEKTDKLLEKYPSTMAKCTLQAQKLNTLDKKTYQILKTYVTFPEEYIAILSNILPEVLSLNINSLIELSNYSQIYIAKNIKSKISHNKVDEKSFILAIDGTINHYLSNNHFKPKRL